MRSYEDINPASMGGQKMLDAGVVHFTNDTTVDVSKSMRFKHRDWYCVAPLKPKGKDPENYDFWVVGVNCCGKQPFDFDCKSHHFTAAGNPKPGGFRWMPGWGPGHGEAGDKAFFRLAVQQAEATHNITARPPLYLVESVDPSAEVASWNEASVWNLFFGIFAFFTMQCV